MALTAVWVTFKYGDDFDPARLHELATASQAKFEGLPGLRSKLFSVSSETREARNVYLWSDATAARRFFSAETRARIAALYGVEPTIDFVEVAALVDNLKSRRRGVRP